MVDRGSHRYMLALLVWMAAGAAIFSLDGQLDLANLSMLLVLAAALSSLWLPAWAGMAASALAVLAFNWFLVPPRYTFDVDLEQNALLLGGILLVNWIISGLMIRQRGLAAAAQAVADREARMRRWADTLREATDPAVHAAALQSILHEATGCRVSVTVMQSWNDPPGTADRLELGQPDELQRSGLVVCVREGKALGSGSGRYGHLPDTYLPLRGRGLTLGAALIVDLAAHPQAHLLRPHLQGLCDQLGAALQRSLMAEHERRAREQAQLQATRNALLAAISHDYRTPLATIMGAASALHDTGERMDAEQRKTLTAGIVEESERLARLTENTLQLARLDAPAVKLACDWESAEEIVGAWLRRARRRPDGHRVRAQAEPGLPLLWCDAMLISQMLDNLLDNGLKYSPKDSLVELHARCEGPQLVVSVSDRGPGIALAWRDKVFQPFQRGAAGHDERGVDSVRGSGLGLAVCRAIARAHQADLQWVERSGGGSVFEFRLSLGDQQALTFPAERTIGTDA